MISAIFCRIIGVVVGAQDVIVWVFCGIRMDKVAIHLDDRLAAKHIDNGVAARPERYGHVGLVIHAGLVEHVSHNFFWNRV